MADCLTDAEADKLLETMTRSGTQELNSGQMRQLKNYCRRDDRHIDRVFRHLFHDLKQNHSQIRVTTVLIIGDLFRRSHRFRQLMTQNLYEFFELCLEMDPKKKLPKPKSFARKLKELTIDLIEKWDKEFGEGYEELRSAVKYLKDRRLIDFNERTALNESQRRSADEKEKKRLKILKAKIEKCVQQLNEIEVEITSLLTQIDSCFDLLLPKMTESDDKPNSDADRSADRVRHLSDFSVEIVLKPLVEIEDNEDTHQIIDNLREFHSELSKILNTKLKHLIQVMSKGYDLCESDLKRGIDLRVQIENVGQKFLELKIIKNEDLMPKNNANDSDSDDSSDDFVEVEEKESLELFIAKHRRHEYDLEPLDPTKPSTSGAQTSVESNKHSLVQCNARLPSGKLCPRRDTIKCPFHGVIVPRDSEGIAIDEEHRKQEEKLKGEARPDWQDPTLLRDIRAATGIDLSLDKCRKRKKKFPELVDIKQLENTSRKRLEKRIFKKSVRERVERDLDEIESKNQTHFEDQWNYSMQS